MTGKRFTIDVEENTQENALFEDDKFVCFEDDTDEYLKKINEMSDENEQLAKEKERYKRLSEIRREEINNRILTLKEFINNCSDNKVRSVLKELFYSEVKEYDLSAQNRKLLHENGQLKSKNRGLQSELQIFKEDATHSNLQINKLIDENEQLKQFQDRVFSWIDMHLQRLPTLRDDEFEFDNEFADPSLYSGAIQILETMKRELKGDVE